MLSLKRFLERLRRLIRWFLPRSVQLNQPLASEQVVFYLASFQPPSELTESFLVKDADINVEVNSCCIELTHQEIRAEDSYDSDGVYFSFPNQFDDSSNPASLDEPTSYIDTEMTGRVGHVVSVVSM